MAWNDKGDGIAGKSLADSTAGLGMTNRLGELFVASCFPVGDGPTNLQDAAGER